MSTKSRPLTRAEIAKPIEQGRIPFVATPKALAAFLGVTRKTIYIWRTAGRLDGTYRRRGKYILFLTDRVLDILFNGTDWK